MYTCGPTVYNYAHVGNLRTYIFDDILRRKTSILKNICIALPGALLKKDLCIKKIPTNNDFLGTIQ